MEFVVQVLKGVAMEMIARCGIEGYLASGRYVDFQAAAVRDKAMELFEDLWEENDRIGAAFVFVRDGIRHSGDVGSRIVTRTASEVLAAGEGICMAKSHLLAALLRCGGIPAALCYQRLLVDDSPGREFRLHGLNAVYLRSRKCWLRIDARGNKPGWRRLEKYAVRCGGGCNHRTGLFDAVLIKDNHLAFRAEGGAGQGKEPTTPAEAVELARKYLLEKGMADIAILEIEVDALGQLADALEAWPDVVLLDNMPPEMLREAVAMRDRRQKSGNIAQGKTPSELEASGGVRLETVRAIAESGVERVSVGALTHSAIGLDIGLDYRCGSV